MTTQNELSLRRVVVALDAAADFATTIEMAASVAAGWGAGLRALFVEDESLWRLAGLPFAQQVNAMTALRSTFNEAELDAQFKLLARQARKELQRIANSHGLSWSLESFRATIGPEALSLTGDELLVVAVASRPAFNALRLCSPWHSVAAQISPPFLLVPERPTTSGPVAVLYEGSIGGRRALEASLRIVRAGQRPLIIVTPEGMTQSQHSEVEAMARSAAANATLHQLPATSRDALQKLVTSLHATLLVVGRNGTASSEATGSTPVSPFSALLVV